MESFSVVTSNAVGFSSSWASDRESSEKCVQANFPSEDKQNQSQSTSTSEAQTEEVVQTYHTTNFDTEKLMSFLSRVTPSVLDELDKIERSKAFTFHETVPQTDDEDGVKELFKLKVKEMDKLDGVIVTSMSWSCTGNVVAVSFGSLHHPEWCSHEAAAYFYNINKNDFDGSTPSRRVATKSCVTATAPHPYEPSLFAVGTYNGEILIWNMQREGEDINCDNGIFHQDKVTNMLWTTVNSQVQLFTSSLDGFIFSFKVSPNLGSTVLLNRFTFPGIPDGPKAGITYFAFSQGQQGIFVTGLEGGALLHCSAVAASTTSEPGSATVVKDPTVKHLSHQSGQVISIAFSNFVHHMFATATAECKFAVHSLNDDSPLFEIWADSEVTGVSWSAAQANVLLAWGPARRILVYDTNNRKLMHKLENERLTDKRNKITIVSCNNKSPKLLAIGFEGEAAIWEVPRYFIEK